MNKLDQAKRSLILRCLTEGNGIRPTSRLADCSINTVMKLFLQAGKACAHLHDEMVKGLNTKRVQCDEIWSFVGKKMKRASTGDRLGGLGDAWTWFAIDADARLIISYVVGQRNAENAFRLIYDCRERIASREHIQITTDQLRLYVNPVHAAFLGDSDYAQLVKVYGCEPQGAPGRYSPAQYMGQRRTVVNGSPDPRHISTSYVERVNLTLRMQNRRFTRLTNGHSKKFQNHQLSVALSVWNYNFCRINGAHRVTPAMEAGIAERVWSLDDLLAFMDGQDSK